jgi:integrase
MPRIAKPFKKGNYYYTDLGGQRRKLCPVREGKQRAAQELARLVNESCELGGKRYPDLRVVELFAKFLEHVRVARSKDTFSGYQHWLTDFANRFGGRPAGQVVKRDAQEYRDGLARRTIDRGKRKGLPYKPKTINHAIIALRRAWNWAIEMEYVPNKNPFAKIPLEYAPGRRRLVNDEEFQKLCDHSTDQAFRDVLVALRFTPCRPSYIRILTWEMVDWERHRWVIWKTKSIGRQKEKKPHLIPMSPEVEEMLRSRRMTCGADAHVFLNSEGRPWTKDALCLRMRRCRQRAGIGTDENGEELVLYTNRHTFLTRAAEGESAFVVQQMAGHTDPRTTNRYVHLVDKQVIEAGLRTAQSLRGQDTAR